MSKRVRKTFSKHQKLEYAKMMVEDGFTNQEIKNISGASDSAVTRWKSLYVLEKKGITPQNQKAITPEQSRIQYLEKQLEIAHQDIDILKKASALFIEGSRKKGLFKR